MERITFGETDGDCEGALLERLARIHYVVEIVGHGHFVLQSADNVGIKARRFDPKGDPDGVGPVVEFAWPDFDELHIY